MVGTPNRTFSEVLKANIDFDSTTLRIALYDDSTAYTFDPDAHDFVNDILDGGTTAQELQGSSGYTGTSDRQTLANVTVNPDDANDWGFLDADDVTWSGVSSSEDVQGWIVYEQVGADDSTPGDDPVILVVDDDMSDAPSNLPIPTNGSDLTVQFGGDGVITLESP